MSDDKDENAHKKEMLTLLLEASKASPELKQMLMEAGASQLTDMINHVVDHLDHDDRVEIAINAIRQSSICDAHLLHELLECAEAGMLEGVKVENLGFKSHDNGDDTCH